MRCGSGTRRRCAESLRGGSFRGKGYVYAVHRVTGVSLYEEWIPSETVRAMAEAFERRDPEAGQPLPLGQRRARALGCPRSKRRAGVLDERMMTAGAIGRWGG